MRCSSSLHLHASSDRELTTYGARPFHPWRALQVRKLALTEAKTHLPVPPTSLYQCCPLKPYSPLGVPRAAGEWIEALPFSPTGFLPRSLGSALLQLCPSRRPLSTNPLPQP